MQAHSFPYQYQRIHFQTGAPGLAVEVTLVPTEEDGLFCSACLLGGANPFAAEFGELGAELAGFLTGAFIITPTADSTSLLPVETRLFALGTEEATSFNDATCTLGGQPLEVLGRDGLRDSSSNGCRGLPPKLDLASDEPTLRGPPSLGPPKELGRELIWEAVSQSIFSYLLAL